MRCYVCFLLGLSLEVGLSLGIGLPWAFWKTDSEASGRLHPHEDLGELQVTEEQTHDTSTVIRKSMAMKRGRRKSPRLEVWPSQGTHCRATSGGRMWRGTPKAPLMTITSWNRP